MGNTREEVACSLFRSPGTESSFKAVELCSADSLEMAVHLVLTSGRDSTWPLMKSLMTELCRLVELYPEDDLEMAALLEFYLACGLERGAGV